MRLVTNDDIFKTLENIRQDEKRQRYMRAPANYQEFLPKTLGYQPRDVSAMDTHLQQIDQWGKQALELAAVQSRNERAKQAMLAAKRQAKMAAQNSYDDGSRFYDENGDPVQSGGDWQNLQPPPPKGQLNINAPLKTYKWQGFNLTLNSSVAGRFLKFLTALAGRGYKVHSLGSYANRNIAGTNTPSLHKYGLAIDINPAQNPVSYGHVVTDLPKGVGALAAKYGLVWGGNWNGPKYDAMHFSVPYGGTK